MNDPSADSEPQFADEPAADPAAEAQHEATEGADEGASRRNLFGLVRDSSRAEVKELRQRIAELEHAVAELRRRKDLTEMDEVELTELASQTAVTIVRAAKARQDEAARFTEELLGEARTTAAEIRDAAESQAAEREARSIAESDERLAAADAEAGELVSQARFDAARLREEADELLARARQDAKETRAAAEASAEATRQAAVEEAEATVADARSQAERIVQRAEEDAARIVEQAVSERDELLAAVSREQRWVRGQLEQIDELRRTTTEAFAVVRQRLDAATDDLSAPAEEAGNIGAELERGAERLRGLTPAPVDDDPAGTGTAATDDPSIVESTEGPETVDVRRSSERAGAPEGEEGDSGVVRVWSGEREGQGGDRR